MLFIKLECVNKLDIIKQQIKTEVKMTVSHVNHQTVFNAYLTFTVA